MRALDGIRLRLVPVTPRNAAQLWELLQQPGLRTYQDLPSVGLKAFCDIVASRPSELTPKSAGRFEWMLALPPGTEIAGWVSLRISHPETRGGEIGYSVLRQHRRKGIATEAVRVLLAEAFETARLERVQAFCVPDNAASRNLLKRLGFVSDGVLPHGATVSGRPVDVLVHKLDREVWFQSGNTIEMPASAYPV